MSELRDMPMCDLRTISTVEEAQAISCIRDVALLILPKDASPEVSAAIMGIQKEDIASTIYLNADTKVNMVNGIHEVRAKDFDATGESVLLVNGVCVLRGLPPEVKGKAIVNGIVLMHENCKDSCAIEFLMVNGVTRCVDFDEVKAFPNTLDIDAEFLEYLAPKTVIVAGNTASFDDTVTVDMLREKKLFFFVGNKLICPQKLAAYLKATAFYGNEMEISGKGHE